jgi:hypothetical protein
VAIHGTIVLPIASKPDGRMIVSRNDLVTEEAAATWIARMKQIYPQHLNWCEWIAKDVPASPFADKPHPFEKNPPKRKK